MPLCILFLGDVVGTEGTSYLSRGRLLSKTRTSLGADFVIANGENAARGNGLTPEAADSLLSSGVDLITGGNHIWRRRELVNMLEDGDFVLRPANFPSAAPGIGHKTVDVNGVRLLVINLIGRTFMEPVDNPFMAADRILAEQKGKFDAAFIDFHAEATSEKLALARYLDGRVSAIVGTHTHIATADAQILPNGTGYQTDAGMCGSHSGILGVKTEGIIRKFTLGIPTQYDASEGSPEAHGTLCRLDSSGKCISIESINF